MDASAAPAVRSIFSVPQLLRAFRIIHPFPTTLNTAATVALAAVAVGGAPPFRETAVLTAAMFCIQAAIGASNDYFDRDLDEKTKAYKPIVRGAISARGALLLAGALAIAAGALTATLGLRSLAVGLVGATAGFAYNWRLKRTLFSPVPFMVALPALPIWIWTSLDVFSSDLWWLLPFGPLIGLAIHLSNTAPDLERDRAAGVRGLAHRLGTARTLAAAWASFAAALALVVGLGRFIAYDWSVLLPGLLLAGSLLFISVGVYLWGRTEQTLLLGFGLISIATAAIAGSWLAAI